MDDQELQVRLGERFKTLPSVVQRAITSADVEAHMRTLAEAHKLHVDQWAILENEVMLTLLGFQKTEDLARNIAKEVGVQEDAAESIAADVSKIVFEPIRAELEKQLPEPQGAASAEGAVEIRERPAPTAEIAPKPVSTPVIAATPPRTAPETKVERAPISSTYGTATPSHERAAIDGDPYREQVK